jgi:hypothetical protein
VADDAAPTGLVFELGLVGDAVVGVVVVAVERGAQRVGREVRARVEVGAGRVLAVALGVEEVLGGGHVVVDQEQPAGRAVAVDGVVQCEPRGSRTHRRVQVSATNGQGLGCGAARFVVAVFGDLFEDVGADRIGRGARIDHALELAVGVVAVAPHIVLAGRRKHLISLLAGEVVVVARGVANDGASVGGVGFAREAGVRPQAVAVVGPGLVVVQRIGQADLPTERGKDMDEALKQIFGALLAQAPAKKTGAPAEVACMDGDPSWVAVDAPDCRRGVGCH